MKPLLQIFSFIFCFILLTSFLKAGDVYSAGNAGTPIKGPWSAAATWDGGNIPAPGDNVYIIGMDSVILDVANVTVNDLTIGGDATNSTLTFSSSVQVKLTVEGNVTISPGGTFRNTGSTDINNLPMLDTIFVYHDFINNGAVLAFRAGTTPKAGVTQVVFVGSDDSHVKSTGAFSATTNRFNGMTINKSGTARVILDSDIFLESGSSSYPASQPYFDLKHGLVETGVYSIVSRNTSGGTSAPVVMGGSKDSYVLGWMGRGMSSTSTATREFFIGDADGYRPIKVRNATGGTSTGHNLRVRLIRGTPATTSISSDIDKVSTVRYYELKYDQSPTDANTAASMSFDRFFPSYGEQDGVQAGNSYLRVAYTMDSTFNWKGMEQIAKQDTTEFTEPAAYWNADSLPSGSWVTLPHMKSSYVAIARATGTTENTLIFTPVGVNEDKEIPTTFSLKQNYPNPFNPTTTIEYYIPVKSQVLLEVYNVLGQMVDRLVDADLSAGTYTIEYNPSVLSSGVYFYRLSTPSLTLTKTMLIAK